MYWAAIENRGDSKHHATTRHGSFVLDTEGNAPNPVDTLLASLCGCVGHYVRDYLREQGIAPPKFAIEAEAAPTRDNTRLAGIDIFIDLKGTELDERQKSDLLKYVERCKVLITLTSGVAIQKGLGRRESVRAGRTPRFASR